MRDKALLILFITLILSVTTTADNILFFYYIYISEKIMFKISSESSGPQTILMECQTLFSMKKKLIF